MRADGGAGIEKRRGRRRGPAAPGGPAAPVARALPVLVGSLILATAAACGQGGTPPGGTGSTIPSPSGTAAAVPRATPSPSVEAVVLPQPPSCPAPATTAPPRSQPLPAPQLSGAAVLATIPTPFAPQGLAVGFGSVWAVTHRTNDVYRIDPATNRAVAIGYTTTTPDSGAFALSAGPDGVWMVVGLDNVVDRVDLSTNTLVTVARVDGAGWVVDTPEGLWVASITEQAQTVSRLDPSSGRILQSVTVGDGGALENGPPAVAYSPGSLWVARLGSTTLVRVDIATGRIAGTAALPTKVTGGLAGNASAVYAGLADGTLVRIDARTGCVTAAAALEAAMSNPNLPVYFPVDADDSRVRIAYGAGAVAVLDARTLAVVRTFRVDDQSFEGGVISGFGSLWFETFNRNTVVRLKA